jgi:predicted nucleic acid-binding protein
VRAADVDTSVVTRWYVPEPETRAALKARKRLTLPLPFPPWLRLELGHAWALKVFRGEMTVSQMSLVRDALEDDIRSGVWRLDAVDIDASDALAQTYTERHTPAVGARSMDVLHVAGAQWAKCKAFITADVKQAALAERVGLIVTRI